MREGLARRTTLRRDGGVVAILTGILMTVFLAMCAFAVDVGHWYLVREQTQKAAESAARAAVSDLPFDLRGARATARKYAALNGFTDGDGSSTVKVTQSTRDPSTLFVEVETTVPNFFTGIFGIGSTTISSGRTASFIGATQLAGQCNRLGYDPEGRVDLSPNCDATAGRLWLNMNAPGTWKVNGDALGSRVCEGGEDGCTDKVNDEHSAQGYFLDVTVRTTTDLTIDLFDPVWVNVGQPDKPCGSDYLSALTPTTLGSLYDDRYASGAESPYCTGDSLIGGTGRGTRLDTTFTLRRPQGDPAHLELHKSLCTQTYDGFDPSATSTLVDQLVTKDSPPQPVSSALAQSFRRWTTLCTVPQVAPGRYLLHIQTAGALGAGNRFSVRATGTTAADTRKITVAAHEIVNIYANAAQPPSSYYLARVPTSAATHTLQVRFFDVGDCTRNCTLTIRAPGGAPARCSQPPATTPGECTIPNARFNGRWKEVDIPIPADYRCTDSSPTACWYRLEYTDGLPQDVTTWTASIDGSPIDNTG